MFPNTTLRCSSRQGSGSWPHPAGGVELLTVLSGHSPPLGGWVYSYATVRIPLPAPTASLDFKATNSCVTSGVSSKSYVL